MGCAPYYAITGMHPLLLFDIVEANYLLPPPDSLLSTGDLIVWQAIALQKQQADLKNLKGKVYQAQNKAAIQFKREHSQTIHDFDFKTGDLVLVQNIVIEKALN